MIHQRLPQVVHSGNHLSKMHRMQLKAHRLLHIMQNAASMPQDRRKLIMAMMDSQVVHLHTAGPQARVSRPNPRSSSRQVSQLKTNSHSNNNNLNSPRTLEER